MSPVRRTRDGQLRISRWRLHLIVLALSVRTLLTTITAEKSAKEWLELLTNQAENWKYEHEKCWLALLTGTPATSGSEGVTPKKVKEKETTVTGYSRYKYSGASGKKLTFSESGAKGVAENESENEVASGLSGTNQEITYWALMSGEKGEEGKVIAWGSCTGTSIGGTGTPVKVAAGKLKLELG